MSKKLITKLLVFIVVGALVAAACGDDSDEGVSTTTQPAGANVATTAGGAAAAAPCDTTKPVVKVAQVYTLSGASATLGAEFGKGTETAKTQANSTGGILGRCIELVVRDDKADPTTGAQVVRQVTDEEKVSFIVGPFSSTVLGATLAVSNAAKVPTATFSGLPVAGDATKYPYTFRVTPDAARNGQAFANYVIKQGWKKVAVLAVNNTLGTSTLENMQAALKTAGTHTPTQLFATGTIDLTTQLSQLKDQNPDGLAFFASAADMANAIKARGVLNWNIPTIALPPAADPTVVKVVGIPALNNIVVPVVARDVMRKPGTDTLHNPKYGEFIELMHKVLNQNPLEGSVQNLAIGYDVLMLFVSAANAIKSVDPDAIRKHLEDTTYTGVQGTYKFTATDHNGVPIETLGAAKANSFKDGSLEEAP